LGVRIAAYDLRRRALYLGLVDERQLQRAARFNGKTHEPLHAINGAVDTIVNSAAAAGEIEQPL
jgi:hypothetical protein